MSVYLGTQLLSGIATNTISNGHSLFDFKWKDHIINEMSWLRSDTFSWQDGTVYDYAYNHLNTDYNGGTSTTETVGSYTITYVLADDGHKITTDETTVANIYNESGSAWYYVIDQANTRFKLPRSKHNKYTETLGVVGNGRNTVYTDGTNDCVFNPYFGSSNNGIFVDKTASHINVANGTYLSGQTNISEHVAIGLNTDPTKSNVLTTPIPQDTDQYKYLYFYVGQFAQSATEQTAGLNGELFNGKADVDLSNAAPNASASAKETIVGWGMPDYSSGVSVSSGYTATYPCLVTCTNGGTTTASEIDVNNVRVSRVAWSNNGDAMVFAFLGIGDVITTLNGTGTCYPLKGVNNA